MPPDRGLDIAGTSAEGGMGGSGEGEPEPKREDPKQQREMERRRTPAEPSHGKGDSPHLPIPRSPRRATPLRRCFHHLARKLNNLLEIYEAVALAPYRREILRQHGRQRDLFLLTAFSDALGVPHPAELYTLELLPHLMEDFHTWHRRVGLERAPEGGWRCC